MRDAGRFDEFYRETCGRVMRYGLAVVGDRSEAQDIVQEAYARAWRNWRTVVSHPAPEAWIRLTVSRLATDRWRWIRARQHLVSRSRPQVDVEPPGEDTLLLTAALRKLPDKQRQALALHYLYDMPVDQVALEMGARPNTVKSWLSRGRAGLATVLGDAERNVLEVS